MKVILGKDEIADAIECYLARQGMNTDDFHLNVRIAVSRSSEDNKIEVDMNRKTDIKDASKDAESEPMEDVIPAAPFSSPSASN